MLGHSSKPTLMEIKRNSNWQFSMGIHDIHLLCIYPVSCSDAICGKFEDSKESIHKAHLDPIPTQRSLNQWREATTDENIAEIVRSGQHF